VGENRRTARTDRDPTTNQQRLTVHDAARRLGISEDAVRMRVKRGTLPADKEGGRLYVLLDIEPTTDRTDELIEELKDRVHRLEYQLDQEREARTEERRRQDTVIAQLSRANEEQARTIRQLEAPAESPPAERESPQTVEEEPERAEPRPDASGAQEGVERRPWWRRVFGR
jgi:Mg2+ and Co2+ transporter CorA